MLKEDDEDWAPDWVEDETTDRLVVAVNVASTMPPLTLLADYPAAVPTAGSG